MKHAQIPALWRGMGRELPLLGSTVAALALFSMASKIMLLLEAAVFAAVALVCWLERDARPQPPLRWIAVPPAVLFSVVGAVRFTLTWNRPILGAVLALGGLYAFYRLCGRLDAMLCRDNPAPALTIRNNWWMPLSAGVFFLMCGRSTDGAGYFLGVPAAMALWWIGACRVPPMMCQIKGGRKPLWAMAAFAAGGICLFQWESWEKTAPLWAAVGAVLSLPSVVLAVGALYGLLGDILSQALREVSKKERYLYGVLAMGGILVMAALFLRSDAFYGTSHLTGSEDFYDLIYTADSPLLVSENAYLWLTCGENDLRQPLFAVFAAPLVGPFYLLGRALGAGNAWMAILLNIPQLLALLMGCLLFTQSLGLRGKIRGLFLGVCLMSYPVLLFSLMMEQYVIGFFYLMVLVFTCCDGRREPACFWAVGGTLLTGVVLAPLMVPQSPRRDFGRWLVGLTETAVGFAVAVVAFGRLDILLGAVEGLLGLRHFSGVVLTFLDKLRQYTLFLGSCLFAPEAGPGMNPWGFLSWQLPPAEGLSLAGTTVGLLAVLGGILRRDRKISRICLGFLGLSVFVLLIMGWGTQENGLILYALYFGWTIWGLLGQLFDALGQSVKRPWFSPALLTALLALLLLRNLPEMARLLQFTLEAYGL